MAKLTFLPSGKSVKVRPGQTLISAARSARVVIPQRCGGHASCLMCRIIVEQGELSPPTALERRKMPENDLACGIRLSCQARTTDRDCIVRLPENKLKSVVQAALERQREEEDWL
jgi:2Fe-2S ferredoxin